MSFPNMSAALWGVQSANQYKIVSRTPVDFESQETFDLPVTFAGSMQPMPDQKLLVKPEGERSWKWYQLWTRQKLNVGDVVVAGTPDFRTYQVMKLADWSKGAYFQYQLTERPEVTP